MLPKTAPKLTTAELLQLIEEARDAELCRDTESLKKILQPIWNIGEIPEFDKYEDLIKAELYRLCGVFLCFYGKYSQNSKNYQTRGKDFLINAIELLETGKNLSKAAEAKINLALCYWNLGEVSETEAILDIIESDFSASSLHPIYFRTCINRLLIHFWKQDISAALKLIEEIKVPMQFCTDSRLQAMFHNQVGIFYTNNTDYEKADFHLKEAVRFAEKKNNKLFVAINLNNLAYLYKETKDFSKALDYVSGAISELNKTKYKGFLPHVLDTKALIYLDLNKLESAIETIDLAIEFFKQGEDYRGLTEAFWTKIQCQFRLNLTEEALFTYGELHRIAIEQIGEVAVKKFAENFTKEIYYLRHLPLTDEVAEFKKAQVKAALIEANGVIGKAAEILQLRNHQALSEILNKQFPELLIELGFKRRAKRNAVREKISQVEKIINNADEELVEYKISRLVLTDRNFSFDFKFTSPQFETYYFNKFLMKKFGITSGAIVTVSEVKEIETGMLTLISEQDKFSVGRAEYDDWANIYFIVDEQGNPIPVNQENIVGEPIGFCPISKADDKYIKFSRLKV